MIEVAKAGLLDLVVDGVPRKALRFGLSESGPLDAASLRAANRAVGNRFGAAGLEMLAQGPTLTFADHATVCIRGGALEPVLDGQPTPWGEAFDVPAGGVLTFARARPGLRAYMAVAGGLDVPKVFGSRCVDLPSELPGLAGRALRIGDRLPIGRPDGVPPRDAEPRAAGADGPLASEGDGAIVLRVLPGPQWTDTPSDVRRHLLCHPFRATPQSSRVGMVLDPIDPPPAWQLGAMVSEGTLSGSVQWPPSGHPVLLLTDRGSIGGYPKPLQVITVDTWRAAQIRPGDRLRFVRVTRTEAWAALREG